MHTIFIVSVLVYVLTGVTTTDAEPGSIDFDIDRSGMHVAILDPGAIDYELDDGDSSGGGGSGGTGGHTGGQTGGGSTGGGSSGPSAATIEMRNRTNAVLDSLADDAAHVAALDRRTRQFLNTSHSPNTIAAGSRENLRTMQQASIARGEMLTNNFLDAQDTQEARRMNARSLAGSKHDTLRADSVGDPVRLSDGAYISLVPMPRITHHGIDLDIAPHYDSTRLTENTFGPGWFSILDSRVVQGATAPLEIQETLEKTEAFRVDRIAEQHEIWDTFFASSGSAEDFAETKAQLSSASSDAEELAGELEALVNTLDEEIGDFKARNVNTTQLEEARDEVRELYDTVEENLSTWHACLDVIREWGRTDETLADLEEELERISREAEAIREQYSSTMDRNSDVLRPGSDSFLGETGESTVVVLEPTGKPVVFTQAAPGEPYRADAPGLGTLLDLGLDRGWRWVLDDGSVREYGPDGYLHVLADRNDNRITLDRTRRHESETITISTDGNDTLSVIRKEPDRLEAEVSGSGEFAFFFAGDHLTEAATPRGTMQYEYTNGVMTVMRNEAGHEVVITWDFGRSHPRVTSVRDPEGNREHFLYPAPTKRIYRDPDGVETTYLVEDGLIVSKTVAGGAVTEYVYDDFENLIRRRTSDGYQEDFSYDERGNRIGSTDSLGFWEQIERDRYGQPTSLRNDRGTVFSIIRDERGNAVVVHQPGRDSYMITRDDRGLARKVEFDRGAVFRKDYDDAGRVTRIVRDDGQELEKHYDDAGRPIRVVRNGIVQEERRFDEAGRKTESTTPAETVQFEYDENGNKAKTILHGRRYRTSDFDRRGLPLRHEYYDDSWEEFSYTPAGHLQFHRDRRGARYEYHRNDAGQIEMIRELETGYEYRWEYDDRGNVITRQEPDGTITTISYDVRGMVEHVQYPTGATLRRLHEPGGVVRTYLTGTDERIQRFDAHGRLVEDTDTDGVSRRIEHSPEGLRETRLGELLRRVKHDEYGRIVSQTFPDGTRTQTRWSISDRPVALEDRTGGSHRFTWDDAGRLTAYLDPVHRRTEWAHSGTETIRTEPTGETIRYRYDLDGRITIAGDDSISYTADNILTITDPSGSQKQVITDVLGRLAERREKDAAAPARIHRWEYTEPGETRIVTPTFSSIRTRRRDGTRTFSVAGSSRWEIEPDLFDYPQVVRSPAGRVSEFSWTPEGTPRTFQPAAPGADRQTFRYDFLGRLVERTVAGETLRIEHDDKNRIKSFSAGSDRVNLHTDPYGRVTREIRYTPSEGTSGPTGRSVDRRYGFDPIGRPSVIEDLSSAAALYTEYDDEAGEITVRANEITLVFTLSEGDLEAAEITGALTGSIPVRFNREQGHSTIRVARSIELRHRRNASQAGEETFLISLLSPSGREYAADALAYVRDEAGRIIGEAALDGEIRTYAYDRQSKLVETSTFPRDPVPGRDTVHLAPDPARRLRRVLTTATPVSTSVSGNVLGLSRTITRDTDGRVRDGQTRWDHNGHIEELTHHGSSMEFTHDPVFNRLATIRSDSQRELDVQRDHRGTITEIHDLHRQARYTLLEQDLNVGADEITIRAWQKRDESDRSEVTTGRYTSLATPDVADFALEIRINRRPFLIVDRHRVSVLFTDVRGSTRGAAILHHDGVRATYRSLPSSRGESASTSTNREDSSLLSPAVPIRETYAGMDRFSQSSVFFSRNRAYLPTVELFTTPDPLLDGLDPYLYADGDPINHVDRDGLYIAPVDTTYFQQDSRYGDQKLGVSSKYSLRKYGCVLVSATRIINSVVGHDRADPGVVNSLFAEHNVYTRGSLLSNDRIARAVEELTGHGARVTSFEPDQVDVGRVAEAIRNDRDTQHHVTARITVPFTNDDGERSTYEHTVTVKEFTRTGEPIVADTSNRNRTAITDGEEVIRYDVFTTSACRRFR